MRDWPANFPDDLETQRKPPYENQADSIMYRKIFAELAAERDWSVHRFNAAQIENEATVILGDRTDEVLRSPRQTLGPPWNKDHRIALAATIVSATST